MGQCHESNVNIKVKDGEKKLVLTGNPNVGKSVFFNKLTGLYVDVSNFPGTTVDINYGRYKDYVVIDTPGVYGVSSFNEEETVARDVILFGDIILNVVDAVHLDRDLFLTKQLIDMGKPMIVALNLMDDVRKNGLIINIQKLEDMLGVPVIPTTAINGEGMDNVLESIYKARVGNRNPELIKKINEYENKVEIEAEALLILEDDENVASRNNLSISGLRDDIYQNRRKEVEEIVAAVVEETKTGASFRTKLGRWMLNPLTGIPLLALTLYVMYKILGVVVAGGVVGFTEKTIMEGLYKPFIESLIGGFITSESFIGNILIGEFGVLTMAPIYILGLLLPLIIGFYLMMAVLEDSGYLPRIAALVDRMLTSLGLNGKAIIPIILGFGCVTMATVTTRILGTKREKIIATVLLGVAIPCSAQLGVIVGLITKLGAFYTMVYVLTIVAVFVLTGTLLNKVMPGKSSHLLIDLPPIRLPQFKNVIIKTLQKTWMFLKEATPLFILGALLISIMKYTNILTAIQNIFTPITIGLLDLPKETSTAFIMGIIRRDFGAAGLTAINMTQVQTLVSLIVMTLFVPCIAAIMVMFKERGYKDALLIWIGSFVVAFLIGGFIALIL
ncbi:MAG: ferrous iron transport protein B [Lutisporaceae bacterium]